MKSNFLHTIILVLMKLPCFSHALSFDSNIWELYKNENQVVKSNVRLRKSTRFQSVRVLILKNTFDGSINEKSEVVCEGSGQVQFVDHRNGDALKPWTLNCQSEVNRTAVYISFTVISGLFASPSTIVSQKLGTLGRTLRGTSVLLDVRTFGDDEDNGFRQSSTASHASLAADVLGEYLLESRPNVVHTCNSRECQSSHPVYFSAHIRVIDEDI